jgi:hypothetical protein
VNNDEIKTFEGNEKLFKIDPTLQHLTANIAASTDLRKYIP